MTKTSLILLASIGIALAGCTKENDQPTLHEVMKDRIDANADKLWDLSNTALNDTAGIDPSKLTEAQWDEIAALADEVAGGAKQLTTLDPIVVNRPGVTISDEGVEGGHSSASVQANVDKDPVLFREMADALAAHMVDLATAARARDPERTALLVDQLDGVCENCHLDFWYPDQKALVEAVRNGDAAQAAEAAKQLTP